MQKPADALPGHTLQPRLRVFHGSEVIIGAGKIMLLKMIAETGSISEAARRMRISYNHAWRLLRGMNASFKNPLIEKTRGGASGGGANVTDAGKKVLSLYEDMVASCHAATRRQWASLKGLLKKSESGPAAGGDAS